MATRSMQTNDEADGRKYLRDAGAPQTDMELGGDAPRDPARAFQMQIADYD